jgi:large subunit ribosomal protein L9
MSKELLLMADVAGLGAEGEVVTVSDGYARNCLLPQKLAAPVSEGTKRRIAKQRELREAQHQAEVAGARGMAQRLAGVSCTLTVKTGGDGKMFGSVTTTHIADALKGQGIELDKHGLLLEAPIKELGVYDVKVKLHPEVQASVKVWVVEE